MTSVYKILLISTSLLGMSAMAKNSESPIDPSQVLSTLSFAKPEFQSCFNSASPVSKEDKFVVEVVVTALGNVTESRLKNIGNSSRNPSLGACLIDKINHLNFGPDFNGDKRQAMFVLDSHSL